MVLAILSLAIGSVGCAEDKLPPFAPTSSADPDAGSLQQHRRPVVGTGSSSAGSGGGDNGPGASCDTDSDCKTGLTCFQGTCVGEGKLRFSMSWSWNTDLDLHVLTPTGTELNYRNPRGAGGFLDVDDCVGEVCRDAHGKHVENIYWETAPPSGEYKFWAHNYAGELLAEFQIEVSSEGSVVSTESGKAPLIPPFESTRFTYSR